MQDPEESNFCMTVHIDNLYSELGLVKHLQMYKLVLQGGLIRQMLIRLLFLGLYRTAAMRIFRVRFLLSNFSRVTVLAVFDMFVCSIRCTLIGGRPSCGCNTIPTSEKIRDKIIYLVRPPRTPEGGQ
jgi:hypothetical protein